MIKLCEPVSVEWFTRGRAAEFDEVVEVLSETIMELSRVNGGRNLTHLLAPALALAATAKNLKE